MRVYIYTYDYIIIYICIERKRSRLFHKPQVVKLPHHVVGSWLARYCHPLRHGVYDADSTAICTLAMSKFKVVNPAEAQLFRSGVPKSEFHLASYLWTSVLHQLGTKHIKTCHSTALPWQFFTIQVATQGPIFSVHKLITGLDPASTAEHGWKMLNADHWITQSAKPGTKNITLIKLRYVSWIHLWHIPIYSNEYCMTGWLVSVFDTANAL